MQSNPAGAKDNTVFVSYSHADRRWVDRLLVHLHPLVREGCIRVFSDRSIATGADWRNEIQAALDAANIAILIISADFLASDFIMNQELPQLLAGAASRGTTIMPIIVAPSLYKSIPSLSQFQAANPPSRPLSAMPSSGWNQVLANLAREIQLAADGI
jgi:hypothetical protein